MVGRCGWKVAEKCGCKVWLQGVAGRCVGGVAGRFNWKVWLVGVAGRCGWEL